MNEPAVWWKRCGTYRRWIKAKGANKAGDTLQCDGCFDVWWELSRLFDRPAYGQETHGKR